jgi:dihydrofolate synthase/folylpolyglutamate synthase
LGYNFCYMAYQDTIDYLYGLQKHGIKLGLENPGRLLSLFGDPQGAFRAVHVAGTNGKGSTSAALASVLRQAGRRVGLFTSPHITSFTERIAVDGHEITENDVVSLAEEIRQKAEGMEPTFFEVVTVMGFLYFKRKGVDWAVVETGMGGRLDATNVLLPRLCIITTVDLDHREFLGEALADMAREKAGIIKKGVPVVSAAQQAGAMEAIESAASDNGAPLYVEGRDFGFSVRDCEPGKVFFDYRSGGLSMEGLAVPLSGDYQARNASLAIKAYELISGCGAGFEDDVRTGLSTMRWPGRLELLSDNPPVFIDGAHNPGAARALAITVRRDILKGGRKLVLVMGVMADKDLEGILAPLVPLASEIIFAAPDYGRAARPGELLRVALSMGYSAKTAPSVKEALRMARAYNEIVLVTGSFYTIGEAREAMGAKGFLAGLREWQANH